VLGSSSSGAGVVGTTSNAQASGVLGRNSGGGDGVLGLINGSAAAVHGLNTGSGGGLEGDASATAAAVFGQNTGSGPGVSGASLAGVGVLAEGATALSVQGLALFSRSGVLTVPAGHASATQPGVGLTPASLVLATLRQDRAGIWVRSAVPDIAARSFTVHLSKAVTSSAKVAWFVVN
jgi:hypothetical protein